VLGRQRIVRAAEQDVRLDADAAKFLDRVLRRFGMISLPPPTTGTSVRCMKIA